MTVTKEQAERLKKAAQFARQAHDEYTAARIPLNSSGPETASALSMAKDLLEDLVKNLRIQSVK